MKLRRKIHHAPSFSLLKDVSSAVEATWVGHCGKVCAGMNWELFPSLDDAKVFNVCMCCALRKILW